MLNAIAGLLLTASTTIFAPPVDYEISLAGNFGEPRPNHFHGGIDIKTGGVEGKPVYSIADGYVSRVTVGLNGFGNAVYVTHPEGVTSVYGHLQTFSPRIKRLLRRWQYEHECSAADVRLSPLDCPVSRGQLIALSGNSGYSFGPHLHLEVHDTRTWDMLDPLSFLSPYIRDSLPPVAHSLMACPVSGEGIFNGGQDQQTFAFSSQHPDRVFTAWGRVGFAIYANDYSEMSYNHYGIKETVLTVDGHEVFRSDVTRIPMRGNRMVNSWGCYDYYFRTGTWFMKSFVAPGNTLPCLTFDDNRGIIDFNEERDYHLSYLLRDFNGNTSTYEFVVRGEKSAIPSLSDNGICTAKNVMRWNRTNLFSIPGMQLVIPAGMLDDDTELRPIVRQQPGRLSPAYSFYSRSLPLFGWGEISIAVTAKVENPEKLYIVSHHGRSRFVGGTFKDGWVTGAMRELGAYYELEYDDNPPKITPVRQDGWEANNAIWLNVSDDKSGMKTYRGYIDGSFVLFEPVDRSSQVVCRLKDTPIQKTGKKRRLKFIAIDNRDNETSFETELVY